jgi:hypothetical protein
MEGVNTTDFFQCDRCYVECRIDSETPKSSDSTGTELLTIIHCPGSKSIVVLGKVTRFQERRGGLWVDVQRWIDAA